MTILLQKKTKQTKNTETALTGTNNEFLMSCHVLFAHAFSGYLWGVAVLELALKMHLFLFRCFHNISQRLSYLKLSYKTSCGHTGVPHAPTSPQPTGQFLNGSAGL